LNRPLAQTYCGAPESDFLFVL